MYRFLTICSVLPLAVCCTKVVLSNDDGWAEKNVRTFYDDLVAAGDSVVLSAPADNESGTGSSDAPATTLDQPCEFNSCPAGSPPEGHDASNPRLNYVNSYPVTSMRYGIQTLSPTFFGGPPDIAVAGPNVGANLGSTVKISGTVGAATEAAKEGIPAIAFSGTTGSQISYTAAQQPYITVYGDLSTNVTQTLAATAKPYLPSNIWLNVNYPSVSSSTCSSPTKFKFVLSRINSAGSGTAADVNTCGSTRLPTETTVVNTSGCYASISVGVATTKGDATAAQQAVVLVPLYSDATNAAPNGLWSVLEGLDRNATAVGGTLPSLYLQNDDIRRLSYHVPDTNVYLELLINYDMPIERAALGRTILNGQQRLRAHIFSKGDSYLDPEDDPWDIDDKRTGKCVIGVASYEQQTSPEQRMKYSTAVAALSGCWDVLYLGRREFSARFMITEGSLSVGHGRVVVGMI